MKKNSAISKKKINELSWIDLMRLCLVHVKVFPENILFSRNAIFRKGKCFHVFGCISKYFSQNILWCLEKKLEKKKEDAKPRKIRTNPEEHDVILRSMARSHEVSIEISISRDRRPWTVLREIAPSDRDRPCVLSLSRSPFARALFARPQFQKSFEVKIGTEMNFCGQRYYFMVNWKWFPENSIFQTNQTTYFTENDFLKLFSQKTNTA